jgi:hypothetical protein
MAKASYVPPILSKVSPDKKKWDANWERTFGKKSASTVAPMTLEQIPDLTELVGRTNAKKLLRLARRLEKSTRIARRRSPTRPPGLSSDVALRMCLPSGPGLREVDRTVVGRLEQITSLTKLLGKRATRKLFKAT